MMIKTSWQEMIRKGNSLSFFMKVCRLSVAVITIGKWVPEFNCSMYRKVCCTCGWLISWVYYGIVVKIWFCRCHSYHVEFSSSLTWWYLFCQMTELTFSKSLSWSCFSSIIFNNFGFSFSHSDSPIFTEL